MQTFTVSGTRLHSDFPESHWLQEELGQSPVMSQSIPNRKNYSADNPRNLMVGW